MRKHFVYRMQPEKRAPAGCGDTKSWFEYYKLGAAGETFVPTSDPYEEIGPGDVMWFFFEDRPHGGAFITKVIEDPMQDLQEIWFDSEKYFSFAGADGEWTDRDVPAPIGEGWLQHLNIA